MLTFPPRAIAERDRDDERAELRDLERRIERQRSYDAGKLDALKVDHDQKLRASQRRAHVVLEVACWAVLLAAAALATRELLKFQS